MHAYPRLLASIAAVVLIATSAPAWAGTPAWQAKIAQTEAALMADPRRALTLAREAADLAAQAPRGEAATAGATAKYLEAEALIGLNRADEAVVPAQAAARLIAGTGPATKLAGDIERTLGAIAGGKGDVQQALRRYQAAYRLFTAAGERRSRSIALLDIGQIYWDAGDYPRMLQYFGQAEELMPPGDANLQLALYNARAEVLRATRRYPEAEAEFARALKAAQTLKSIMLEVRILTNLAGAQALAGKLDAAGVNLRRGLVLSRDPDVAEWRPFLHGVAAQIAARRGQSQSAARWLDQAFAGQDLTKTEMSFREMHELAAGVMEAVGRQDDAFRHLRAFQRLDKEAQSLIATNSAQLMAAQFDFTNQNLRISQLKQGQLERDIQYRTNLFTGLLVAGIIILALMGAAFVSIRRSRDRVRAANTELAGTNDQLESALKAKSEFLATTSHEIRTPLNGILGMTQVLLADRRVDAGVREKIEVVHGAGEAMRALVDDLLDVAKLENGGLTLAIDRTDVVRLLEDTTRLWRDQAEGKGIVLAMEHDPLPVLMTDGARVRQILFNLLSNAVKFTPEGRVDLRCALEQAGGGDGGDAATLVITVADSGIGIAPEHHASIFEAFAQVDGGTTRQFSGTGLGLSIVFNLAHALGGTVAVESDLGQGSTFTVRLPLAIAPALGTTPVATAAGSPELATAGVLVVDGNPATQGLLRILLMGHAADVDASGDLADAVARIAAGGIDLVLADASSLPGAPDEQLAGLRALADAARASGARLSILQAPDLVPSIADLFTVGADQLIAKPIDLPALIDALAALWSDDPPAFVAPSLCQAA